MFARQRIGTWRTTLGPGHGQQLHDQHGSCFRLPLPRERIRRWLQRRNVTSSASSDSHPGQQFMDGSAAPAMGSYDSSGHSKLRMLYDAAAYQYQKFIRLSGRFLPSESSASPQCVMLTDHLSP